MLVLADWSVRANILVQRDFFAAQVATKQMEGSQ